MKPQLQETEYFSISAIESVDIISPLEMEEPVLASIESQPSFLNVDLESRLIQETRRVKRDSRMSFLKPEEDSRDRSKLSTAALVFGSLGVICVLLGFGLLIGHFMNELKSDMNKPALGLLISGIFVGLLGLFIGIGGSKTAKVRNQKGRGLAIAGFIGGIASIVLALLALFAGAIGHAW